MDDNSMPVDFVSRESDVESDWETDGDLGDLSVSDTEEATEIMTPSEGSSDSEWMETPALSDESRESDGETGGEIDGSVGDMHALDEFNNTVAEERTGNLTPADQFSEPEWLEISNDSSESNGEANRQIDESGSEQHFVSLRLQEEPHDNPSLGLLGRLPRTVRDTIYDLCYQEKRYRVDLRRRKSPRVLHFSINALLPQIRLVSR